MPTTRRLGPNAGRANTTYTVSRHAIDDLLVFGSHTDKREFINRVQQRLGTGEYRDAKGRLIPKFNDDVELLALIVLDNHFHMVIHQKRVGGIDRFLLSVLTSYGRYYNDKHGRRRTPLFRASNHLTEIASTRQLQYAIAYVHLNDEVQKLEYPYSTHPYFMGESNADWVSVDKTLRAFGGRASYIEYLRRMGPTILDNKLRRRSSNGKPPAERIRRGPGSHRAKPPKRQLPKVDI